MRNIWTDKTNLTISCARGAMPFLKQELSEMGYKILGGSDTMVGIEAPNPARDIMRLNLHLRTAQRVLWPFFQSTKCRNIKDLYDLAYYAPWEEILSIDHPFVVNNITINNPTILDTRMPTLKMKDAIVDRLREKLGKRPNVAGSVPIKASINGCVITDTHAPLRRAEERLTEDIELWLSRNKDLEGYVPVDITVDGHPLMDGDVGVNKINAKTIVDRLQKRFGDRLTQSPDTAAIFLHWDDMHAKCYIDTSSVTLSRRNYRLNSWKAPMQESLAAACIMATGWDKKSPFVVPFCGSGTPAIEAAMIAANVAPGIFRSHFGFMFLKGWDNIIPGESAGSSVRRTFGATPAQIWKDMIAQAKDAIVTDPDQMPPIIASDIEWDAIDQALSNAIGAGINTFIKFQSCDFAATEFHVDKPGLIFMNPPYGERLEDDESLMPLYTNIGTWLKTKPGWQAWLITSSRPLSLQIKLKTSAIVPFWNGSLECRLLGYKINANEADVELTAEEQAIVDSVHEAAEKARQIKEEEKRIALAAIAAEEAAEQADAQDIVDAVIETAETTDVPEAAEEAAEVTEAEPIC